MAQLPADRTKLAQAQGNMTPTFTASSQKLKDALTEAYDTIDTLNQKVDNHGSNATLPHPDKSVTRAKLADKVVGAGQLDDAAVTLEKLAEDAKDSANHTYNGVVAGSKTVKNAIDTQNNRIDNIVSNAGSSNIEIVDARLSDDGSRYLTLKQRLDTERTNVAAQLTDIAAEVDGKINDISVSSTSAWSSSKTIEQIQLIPKGDKGDTGSASISINDNETSTGFAQSGKDVFDRYKESYLLKKEPVKLPYSNLWEVGHVDGDVGTFVTWTAGKQNTNTVRLRTIKAHPILPGTYKISMATAGYMYSYRTYDLNTGGILVSTAFATPDATITIDRDCLIGFQLRNLSNTNVLPADAVTCGITIKNTSQTIVEKLDTIIDDSNVFGNTTNTYSSNKISTLLDSLIDGVILTPSVYVHGSVDSTKPYSAQPDTSVKRYRFKNLVALKGNRTIEFNNATYRVGVMIYDMSDAFVSDSGWLTTSGYLINRTGDYKVNISLMRTDNGDMTDSDITAANIKIVNPDAVQSKVKNITSDAAVTNNTIARLNNRQSGITRFATWNIAFSDVKYAEAASLIMSNAVNFIGVEEYHGGTNPTILSAFANTTLPNYHYNPSVPGLATLSLTNFYKISEQSIPFALYGGTEQRVASKVVAYINGKLASIYTVHLEYDPPLATTSQIADVISLLNADTNYYKIVVGDFNPDNNADFDPFISAGYKLSNGKNGVWFDTFKTPIQSTRSLDNIIVGSTIDIVNVRMIDTDPAISDHNMLIADLFFN